MGELPVCRICGSEPIKAKIHGVVIALHPDCECPLNGSKRMTPDQWRALMGGAEPVAFVPIHPRTGPLWGDVYPAGNEPEGRPERYERMPLYAHPAPAVDGAVLMDAVAAAIGNHAYDCSRDWSAWSYGTMSAQDFSPLVNDINRLQEIVDAVKYAMKGA